MIKQSVIAAALLATVPLPAYALEEPHCGPKDMRMCTAPYDPRNPIHIWSAPGSIFVVRFADDEKIVRVKSADYDHLGKNGTGFIGNLLTLKFLGCLMPEPFFVFSQKEDGYGGYQERVYTFQIDTIPQVCSTTVPGPQVPVTVQAQGGVIPAANAAELPPSMPTSGEPNFGHLEHPDDLANGRVPYMLTITYPVDVATARHKAGLVRREHRDAQLASDMLHYAAGPINGNYKGFGDRELKPSRATDDGYTTTLIFPQMQAVPALSRIENQNLPWCGIPGSAEATADFAVHGSEMKISGTAQAWCLRYGNKVYEVFNLGYNGVGFAPGTGTASPSVQRIVGP